MNRRLYERTDVSSEVEIEFDSKKVPGQMLNISGNGVCFLIDKSYVKDISDWEKGLKVKFEFKVDNDEGDEIIPHYTCTIMHIEEMDDKYKVGASVAEEVLL